ncbi:hypothetical protein ACRAWG_21455 [Methylobacterium sp. P31]
MATRTLLTLLALVLVTPASAQTFRAAEAYVPSYAGDDGFAGEFVHGTYIGAPLTRVPRPTQIVPAPWSYGTYGIPTVSGIAALPAAQPTLTVINASGPDRRRHGGAAGENRVAGAHVITVQVPRR